MIAYDTDFEYRGGLLVSEKSYTEIREMECVQRILYNKGCIQ